MPNWCNNELRVSGPAEDIARFKQQAVGFSPWNAPPKDEKPSPLNFHSLVPIPDGVLKAGYEDAGYDWENNHWGCKWGACHADLVDDNGSELFYSFDTAWAPPIGFLDGVAKLWPSLIFVLEYEEGGMGFKGLAKAHDETIEDHCISL